MGQYKFKTTFVAQADRYPAMGDGFEKFEGIRADTLARLATLDDDLDQASNAPGSRANMEIVLSREDRGLRWRKLPEIC